MSVADPGRPDAPKEILLRKFLVILWAVFWRSLLVMVANTLATYGLSQLTHALFIQTDFAIKVRLSLGHFAAAMLFGLLAIWHAKRSKLAQENRSPLNDRQWRQTWSTLAAGSVFIVAAELAAAMLFSVDFWIATTMLLPLPTFIILWLGLALRFSKR